MTTQDTRRVLPVIRQDGTAASEPARSDRSTAKAPRSGAIGWFAAPAFDFYALIILGALLVSVGLMMVLSSSSVTNIAQGQSGFAGLRSQGMFAAIGVVGLVIAACIPPRVYHVAAPLLFVVGLLLQLLVFSSLGFEVAGNRNWILIGGYTLQPSELLKLALAVWLGAVLANKRHLLGDFKHLFFPMVPGVLLALALVVGGKDLGTMMVMAMLVAGALWVAGVPHQWFVIGFVSGAAAIVAMTMVSANRMARISNWIHGECPGDSCMQYERGLMGLAEGGLWGVGPGESRQKWGRLPAAQDDYIFAIIGEEFGLIGTLGVLGLFLALAFVLLRMIARVSDRFQQITIAGVASWLLGQAFVNMMVVTGLLPVLGVPLPFISSGGSALLASMLALGMLISFARHEPGAKEAITARTSRVRRSISVLPARREPSSKKS